MFIFRVYKMSKERKREFIKEKSLLVKEGFVIANYNEYIKAYTVVCEKCGDNQVVREEDLENLTCTCECRIDKVREMYDNRLTYEEVKERLLKKDRKEEDKKKREERCRNIYKERERRNALPSLNNNFDANIFSTVKVKNKVTPQITRKDVIKEEEKFIIVDVIGYTMGQRYLGRNLVRKNYVICKLVTANGDSKVYYIEEENFKQRKFFKPYIYSRKPNGYQEIITLKAELSHNIEIPSGYFGLDVNCAVYYEDEKDLYVLLTNESVEEPIPCKLIDYCLYPVPTSRNIVEKYNCKYTSSKSYISEIYFDKEFTNDFIKHALDIKKFVFMIN